MTVMRLGNGGRPAEPDRTKKLKKVVDNRAGSE